MNEKIRGMCCCTVCPFYAPAEQAEHIEYWIRHPNLEFTEDASRFDAILHHHARPSLRNLSTLDLVDCLLVVQSVLRSSRFVARN